MTDLFRNDDRADATLTGDAALRVRGAATSSLSSQSSSQQSSDGSGLAGHQRGYRKG